MSITQGDDACGGLASGPIQGKPQAVLILVGHTEAHKHKGLTPMATRPHADRERPKVTGSSHVDTHRDTQIWGPHGASPSRLLLYFGPIWLELDLTCFSGRADNIKGSPLSSTPL